MTNSATLGFLALLLYVGAESVSIVQLRRDSERLGRATTILLAAGILVHFIALQLRARALHSVPYRDLADSMSLFSWMLAASYGFLLLRHRERSTGPFLIPLVILFLAISLLTHPAVVPSRKGTSGSLFAFHVTMAILGYAALSLSFVLALLYLVQTRQIRERRMGLLFSRLPALDALDRLQHTAIAAGVCALSLATVLGLIWAKRTWGTVADPKVLWTLFTIAIYGAALFSGPLGIKGKKTAFLSITGYGVLLFSYTIVNLFLTREHIFR